MSPRLRTSTKLKAGTVIQEFFTKSKIPRSSDRILQSYVNEISRPYDWEAYVKRWRGDDDDEDDEREDEDEETDKYKEKDNSRSESGYNNSKSNRSTSSLSPPAKSVLKKRYVTHGIYYTKNKKRKTSSVFPLPIHNGLETMDSQRDFVIPYDIYCPRGVITRVANWRPLKRNVWVDVPPPPKSSGERPICDCTHRCDEDCLNRLLQFECDSQCCPFGEKNCGNRALQTLSKDLKEGKRYAEGYEVIKTGDRGHGLRATRGYKQGELIIEYTGDVISQTEMQRRLANQYRGINNYYFLSLEKGSVIDSGTRGSAARFVNHSCSPNCQMQKWYVGHVPRIGLFAARNISAGEELLYDYNFVWFDGAEPQICLCGSDNCRGIIGQRANGSDRSKVSPSTEPPPSTSITASAEKKNKTTKIIIKVSPNRRRPGRPSKSTTKPVARSKRIATTSKTPIMKVKNTSSKPLATTKSGLLPTPVSISKSPTTLNRGPGRPAKVNSLVMARNVLPSPKIVLPSMTKTIQSTKKRRGRPSKDLIIEEPIPKRRGRPPSFNQSATKSTQVSSKTNRVSKRKTSLTQKRVTRRSGSENNRVNRLSRKIQPSSNTEGVALEASTIPNTLSRRTRKATKDLEPNGFADQSNMTNSSSSQSSENVKRGRVGRPTSSISSKIRESSPLKSFKVTNRSLRSSENNSFHKGKPSNDTSSRLPITRKDSLLLPSRLEKRKPGRPPRVKVSSLVSSNPTNEKNQVKLQSSAIEPLHEVSTRRRGRPKGSRTRPQIIQLPAEIVESSSLVQRLRRTRRRPTENAEINVDEHSTVPQHVESRRGRIENSSPSLSGSQTTRYEVKNRDKNQPTLSDYNKATSDIRTGEVIAPNIDNQAITLEEAGPHSDGQVSRKPPEMRVIQYHFTSGTGTARRKPNTKNRTSSKPQLVVTNLFVPNSFDMPPSHHDTRLLELVRASEIADQNNSGNKKHSDVQNGTLSSSGDRTSDMPTSRSNGNSTHCPIVVSTPSQIELTKSQVTRTTPIQGTAGQVESLDTHQVHNTSQRPTGFQSGSQTVHNIKLDCANQQLNPSYSLSPEQLHGPQSFPNASQQKGMPERSNVVCTFAPPYIPLTTQKSQINSTPQTALMTPLRSGHAQFAQLPTGLSNCGRSADQNYSNGQTTIFSQSMSNPSTVSSRPPPPFSQQAKLIHPHFGISEQANYHQSMHSFPRTVTDMQPTHQSSAGIVNYQNVSTLNTPTPITATTRGPSQLYNDLSYTPPVTFNTPQQQYPNQSYSPNISLRQPGYQSDNSRKLGIQQDKAKKSSIHQQPFNRSNDDSRYVGQSFLPTPPLDNRNIKPTKDLYARGPITLFIPESISPSPGVATINSSQSQFNENDQSFTNINKDNSKKTSEPVTMTVSNTFQTPSGSSQTPSGSSQTPSGSSQTPSGSSQTPSGSSQTPSSSSQRPGGYRVDWRSVVGI